MMNKESILKRVTNIEDKLLVSKALDKAVKADKSKIITYTDFLDPHQRNVIERAFSGYEDLEFSFNGGFDDAERTVLFFYPEFIYGSDDPEDADAPFKLVTILTNGRDKLTHRDYLGSLMGLGIKREKIGDILVRDDQCDVIVLEEIADYIKYNLNKVGNSKVSVEVQDVDNLEIQEPKTKTINTTVASLRLDCISSAGFGVSRSKMADFIRAEKVSLNWDVTGSVTKLVQEGDTISVRGKGRVVVEQIGKITKKGRVSVVLKKLV